MSPTGVFDFCEGDNITFSANGDLNADDDFFWKIGTTTATGDTFALEMTPAVSGQSLELYLVTSAGCTSTLVNQIISVTQSLTFGLDTDKPGDTVCAGDDIQIQVTLGPGIVGTTTYTYDLGAGGVVVSNTPTITASFNQETDVQVTVENGECNSITETITVFVPLLDNTVGGGSINPATITVCAGERLDQDLISNTDATLAANSSAASVTYQWQRWTGTQWQNLIGAGTNSSSLLSSTLVTFTASDTQLRRVAYATRNGQSCDEKYAFVNINISAVGTPVIMSPTGVFDFCEAITLLFCQW